MAKSRDQHKQYLFNDFSNPTREPLKGAWIWGKAKCDMEYLEKTLYSFNQQAWSYGLIRYEDLVTGEEVHQIDAHEGDKWENGTRCCIRSMEKTIIFFLTNITNGYIY